MVFTVTIARALAQDLDVTYVVDASNTSATSPDDYELPDSVPPRTVTIAAGQNSAEISVTTVDEMLYEGPEELVLVLDSLDPPGIAELVPQTDPGYTATGEILDATPGPHLFIAGPDPSEEVEGGRRTGLNTVTAGTLTFRVRLRDENNTTDAPSATAVSVEVRIEDITTTASDYSPVDTVDFTWSGGSTTLTFDPGDVAIDVVVQTLDDTVGEETETFELVLVSENAGAPLGSIAVAVGTIIDDEARVSVENVRVDEGDASSPGTLQFQVVLDRAINADLTLQYELVDPDASFDLDTARRGTTPLCAADDDYLDTTPGTLLIAWPHDPWQPSTCRG